MRRTRSGPSIREFLKYYLLVLLAEKAQTKQELVQQIKQRSADNRTYRTTGVVWPASSEMDRVLDGLAEDGLVRPPKRGYKWRITDSGKQTLAERGKQQEETDGKERAAEKLVELLETAPANACVLDVGTGAGFLALKLAERGFRVVGIDSGSFDYSKDSLGEAREEATRRGGDVEFRQIDIATLAESHERFDYVVSSQAVHCMDDQPACLEAIHTLLKPGGRFLCVDFLVGSEGFIRHGFHCFLAFSREEWVERLIECGFVNIRMHEMCDYVLVECEKA